MTTSTPTADAGLPPNHHARHPGFAGIGGLSFTVGRDADAGLATGLTTVGPDDDVVDVGCGPGVAVRRAAALGAASVIGVDPAAVMLRVARVESATPRGECNVGLGPGRRTRGGRRWRGLWRRRSRLATDHARILTTLLFTDVVGSTDRVAAIGDRAWRTMLDRHDDAIRRQLARFSGQEEKLTGDGMLATFDGPARAIRCGTAIRDAARQIRLDVRVGIHTGEVERRGTELAGIAVHLARRVCQTAPPGEVLVSRTVVDLVAGSGIAFDDRGEHELKGIPVAWRLFAVTT